ncbi:thiamine kinase-like enzyme [Roseovarius halotolerans]|uniref:Choline/ethanolamine kinase n=1 Tax=Roseovarius halotolerans TaxID=505353 RepID=A0A1X6ZRT6_9RHOB|nr:choline/ethanolamine kinase family protein [Roseovarius halotolerans]RKT27902.1 thiamine kinase-like enzyme [Roseovarius halotolerans]SLN59744.1 Choline/ethanolamine kinase [Roseovarius halotolerans]
MRDDNRDNVIAVLRKVPGFEQTTPETCEIERLGGMTNLVYRVETGGQNVIVRIPGEGTEAYIDRAVEIHNTRVAADTGVCARVIWADEATGDMVCECIMGIVTMTPELFASRAGAAARAGAALRQLHDAETPFQFRFELFSMIDDYLEVLSTKDIELPEGYEQVVAEAAPIKQLLAENPGELVPSHCDPLCENFLDDGTRMWIVDYEYSGMNDALWDLGDLSVEAGMSDAQDIEMLTAYFGAPPTAAQIGRTVIYKAMCDLLWTLWGLIQHADNNPAEDFWAYAVNRFARCKALMSDPAFAGHLAAVRAG